MALDARPHRAGPRRSSSFADWTERIEKGEVPEPSRRGRQGVERNIVTTLWAWGGAGGVRARRDRDRRAEPDGDQEWAAVRQLDGIQRRRPDSGSRQSQDPERLNPAAPDPKDHACRWRGTRGPRSHRPYWGEDPSSGTAAPSPAQPDDRPTRVACGSRHPVRSAQTVIPFVVRMSSPSAKLCSQEGARGAASVRVRPEERNRPRRS